MSGFDNIKSLWYFITRLRVSI
ncbi:MAG: PTS transporter subunit EIIB [Clostridiales bacterium]|nr:PTS transporter subunit EIIB [Clostridiales bacterium]